MASGRKIEQPSDEVALLRWERATAYPLTALSVLFIAVYAWPILQPGLEPALVRVCDGANIAIWALFGVEYLIRLRLARRKGRFIRTHWFDLGVLILPVLRPLRALRLITALKVLHQRAETWTRGRLALYVGASTVLLVLVAGLAVLDAERGRPDAGITSYPEALWWGVVTITTVGYGDFYPTTIEGRIVALAMMVAGIGLIGFVTGSVASWIVERIAAEEEPLDTVRTEVHDMLTELRELRTEVAELRAEMQSRPPGP